MVDQAFEARKTRRVWVAVVLSVLNSSLAMLYLCRPRRAGLYLLGMLACPAVAFALARNGLWRAGLPWSVLAYAVAIPGIFDAYRIAKWHQPSAIRWSATWKGLVAIVVAFVALVVAIRVFLYEPFIIPSAAMLPTLRVHDQIFVSKFAFLGRAPERGDVIVFRLPDGRVNYVKRVIGLPGDVVGYDVASDDVTLNGQVIDFEPVGVYSDDPSLGLVRETIDGRSHVVARMQGVSSAGGTYRVPEGAYFVLGDNRDNSRDSRYDGFGFVPRGKILGKVTVIWWNDYEPKRAGIVPD